MWGNEYDSQKLQYVEDLIRHSEEYVELECSYAIGGLIELITALVAKDPVVTPAPSE